MANQVILFCLANRGGGMTILNIASCCPPCTEGKTEVAEDAAEGSAINRAAENLKYISVLFWR